MKKRILLVVEGKKTEVRIMNLLLSNYKINNYEIISYCTTIYSLYNKLISNEAIRTSR
jgi:hypothetical protein